MTYVAPEQPQQPHTITHTIQRDFFKSRHLHRALGGIQECRGSLVGAL